MCKYLPIDEFKDIYPLKKQLIKGAYGKIYESENNHVIKEFDPSPSLIDLATELNIYAYLFHPCIMKPLAWSVENTTGYIAMDRGIDIKIAYRNKLISIEEIISDTLSAIAYMNENGIAHCDIKPDNIIFHDGKAKIIDMSLARRGDLDVGGEYYIYGVAYTPLYSDPEYSNKQYNNIKTEIYALALTYIEILTNKCNDYGHIYNYESKMPHVDWFIGQARRFHNERPCIKDLLHNSPTQLMVRGYLGMKPKNEPININFRRRGRIMKVTMQWAIAVAIQANIKAKSLFLCLHLLHRIGNRHKNKDSKLLVCVCMSLSMIVLYDRFIDFSYWKQISECFNADYEEKFVQMTIDVLSLLEGVVLQMTYWDYAKSREDLLQLLYDTVNCNYNPEVIRTLTEGSSKCVRVPQFICGIDLFDIERGEVDIPSPESSYVQPSYLPLNDDVSEIKAIWDVEKISLTKPIFIGVILRNRDSLNKLDITTALKILMTLSKRGNHLDSYILNTICKFDWRNRSQEVVEHNLHPFNMQEEQLPIYKESLLSKLIKNLI